MPVFLGEIRGRTQGSPLHFNTTLLIYRNRVPGFERSALDHFRENSLARHEAVADFFHDFARGVTRLADLRDPENDVAPRFQDRADLDIFKRDWHWLVASETYSPEFMLKYRAPTQQLESIGRLKIRVLRNRNNFIGFVAYYMKSPIQGFVLFLDVNPEFRGRGYSDKLLQYALKELLHMGAYSARLVTRTTNYSAQKLYKRNGFSEVERENGFIYFEKRIK